jgi:hypothetical protein
MGRGCVSFFPACAVLVVVVSASVGAQGGHAPGSLYDAALPGGLPGAAAAIGDPVDPDPSQFLLEVIRRFHSLPEIGTADSRFPQLTSLVSRLDEARGLTRDAPPVDATVPLPLPPSLWIDAVFAGRARPGTLVGAILRSRDASLLYAGLLSLDDGTREWLAARPAFVRYLVSGRAARFLVAAPGLRVKDGHLVLPGGPAAEPAWRELLGQANAPEDLIRTILEARRGSLAYAVGSLASLGAGTLSVVLELAQPLERRIESLRRIHAAFEHVAFRWKIDQQPFWRPPLDPALLASELPVDAKGLLVVPGSHSFWSDVFGESKRSDINGVESTHDGWGAEAPASFGWLCDQVFAGSPIEQRRRYDMVLFASRVLPPSMTQGDPATVEAVRATGQFPALTGTLERAGLVDPRAYAAAARRAAALSRIGKRPRAIQALVQFQGALALITRGALRRRLPDASLSALVSSLSGIDPGEHGEYEGRIVSWLDGHLPASAARGGSLERRSIAWLSGPPSSEEEAALVEWEGTRYRVDPVHAEAVRLSQILGEDPPPFLTSARALVEMAAALEREPTSEGMRAVTERVRAIIREFSDELPPPEAKLARGLDTSLQRAARGADLRRAARLAAIMRQLADGLLGRGLLEFTYAAAFGQPGVAAISVGEAAARHDLGGPGRHLAAAWQWPEATTWPDREWRVTGAVLGLDVRLAGFSLVRISPRPPPRVPTLTGADRRVFVEAVGLAQPSRLTDARRDEIVAALARGRARLARVQSPSEVTDLADEIELSPTRRALLRWTVARAPERVPAFLSLTELLWLGAGPNLDRQAFDAWGSPAEPRAGCLCLRFTDRRSSDSFAGRWNTGMLASHFPDLNLRLTELLAALNMPAVLLPSALAPATLELIENAARRDEDDRRGLLEYVRTLGRERAEQYLALLTTGGPLVPIGDATGTLSRTRHPQ